MTNPTTVEGWLSQIKNENLRRRALDWATEVSQRQQAFSIADAIGKAFPWSETPEGAAYWRAVHDSFLKGKEPMASADIAVRVGVNIRFHRKRLKLSQERLAQGIGKKGAWLSFIENGTRNILLPDLVDLAGALGVALNDLLE